ncbi:bifunctional metallophosphatase/5'-nucleotidase [Kerstersia similis]|uniref:bifunctional metallophosphatase/5'-nucleotidase n=1 Tax=Kerstersia similis TaxID=206505 RepID=UPI0039EE9C55
MNFPLRASALAMMLAGLLSACGSDNNDSDTQEPSAPLALTILHINDHHSHLDSESRTVKLKNPDGTVVDVTVPSAGFPRVTTAFQQLAAGHDNVLKLHAGDALTGTLYFNRAGSLGAADAALMNTVCFDAMAIGNHEFDKGDAGLETFIDELHSGSCKTPVLSANVQFGNSSPLKGSNKVSPSTVIQRDGQSIGLVGLTIASKTKQSSSPNADTEFEDEVVAAQREIDRLQSQGVNKIVMLSHIGYTYDLEVASKLKGVDVIVGGDSHTLLGPKDKLSRYLDADISQGYDYPTRVKDKDGNTVCVVHAWEYSQVVGELTVNFDANGKVENCEGTPRVLIGDSFQVKDGSSQRAATTAEASAFQADIKESGILYVAAEDQKAVSTLAPFKAEVDKFKAKQVAIVPQELCSRRVPGGPGSIDYSRSASCANGQTAVSARGGDIQQLVAQAYYDIANSNYGGADIALQNGGGVRVPLKGNVTAANVIEVLPFANMLWKMTVSGQEVKDTLEDAMDMVFNDKPSSGPYPYAGGLRWHVDAKQPKGQRVSKLEVFNRSTQQWQALDLQRQDYTLFLLSFVAQGGDGYATLGNLPDSRRLDVGVLDADAFQEWIDTRTEKDGATGLPILRPVNDAFYSTQGFTSP